MISKTMCLLVSSALCVGLAACGGDDDDGADASGGDATESAGTIAYAVAGDRNDGGYYQGQVEAVEGAAEAAGFEVVVLDKVNPGAAREAFENLARQGPDLIIAGGSELGEGFTPVSEAPEFADIDFLMVTAAPPETATYATVGANERHAHLMGGVAAGLVLERAGASKACIVAGPELPFVQNAEAAMRSGLGIVDESFELLVTYTGSFEDATLAQEATSSLAANGCAVMYPYLGGAVSAAVGAANDAGVPAAATSIDRCGDDSAEFAMSILYNPSLYLEGVIAAYADGELVEGESLGVFGAGDGVGIGAVVCDATPEEQELLQGVEVDLAAGDLDDLLPG
jgi:basic membrane protein A